MVVFPAASKPTIRMRISFLPQSLSKSFEKVRPIFAVVWGDVWVVERWEKVVGEESVRDLLPSADNVTCQLLGVLRMRLLRSNG
jgi:hypothetical protein